MSEKRYLTGADWLAHALNAATRRGTPVGNHSQIVLDLAEDPGDLAEWTDALRDFSAAFPELGGRLARAWTLEPYWKLSGVPLSPAVETRACEEGEGFVALERFANEPFAGSGEYLRFLLLRESNGPARWVMKFDHRLFDARGAERFLWLFSRYVRGEIDARELAAQRARQASLLNRWAERFRSGRTLLRELRGFSGREIASLATDAHSSGDSVFLSFELDEGATDRMIERANREAGFLMFMPYALAVCASAFCAARPPKPGEAIVIPCTVDLRGNEPAPERTLFNAWSSFFFLLEPEDVADRAGAISSLKRRFYELRKAGFAEAMERTMVLMRILPVPVFEWLARTRMRHCFGSFSFASLGPGPFDAEGSFCGIGVENLRHMPQIPPQSGLGFFFNRYRNRINLGVSYRRGLLDSAARRRMERALRSCWEAGA